MTVSYISQNEDRVSKVDFPSEDTLDSAEADAN